MKVQEPAERTRFYDLTPRFPITHDGQTVAWCVDEETQAFLQSVLDGDVWDAKEIRALAERYRAGLTEPDQEWASPK